MVLKALILILLSCTCYPSYSKTEGWQVYPSYSEAVQVEVAGNFLYCIMRGSGTINSNSGNLVRYDIEDESIKTFDCLSDLSDKEITRISHNRATERLIIIYKSGSIDLLDADDETLNISALKESSISGERVYNVNHIEEIAYICTDNSIIELDAQECVIRETYKTEIPACGIFQLNKNLYIALKDGIYQVEDKSKLIDKGSWKKVVDLDIETIVSFDGNMYAISSASSELHYIMIEDNSVRQVKSGYSFSHIFSSDDKMICFNYGNWFAYFKAGEPTSPRVFNQAHTWVDLDFFDDKIAVADKSGDVCYYVFDEAQSCFISESNNSLISINSPKRDLFNRIQYYKDRLLVAGGINSQTTTYYPVTFMSMDSDGRWTNFDETSAIESNPKISNVNAVALVQNPNNEKQFFGAVWRNGLHEYHMNSRGEVEFKQLFNYTNSPLRSIDVPVEDPWNYCTCTALQYDRNGNLWMANQQTDTIVRIMRPNGKWIALYYPEIVKAEIVFQYLFSSHDINFIVTYQGGKRGFFGFDTSGTLNTTDDDRHLLRNVITNQDGATVMPTHYYCMTEDQDRQIWCGTNEGLFVITDPTDWFESDFYFHQIKRNRDDGSGLADYLLAGVDITCITVDASNRKWIGTQGNGVYLVSHDGQETIHNFTSENSPLLSNNVTSIAINPNDGRVMFGTDAGLCSYAENVTKAEDVLSERNVIAYPNPIRPNTNSIVTIKGLTDGAEVKIINSSGQAVWGTKSIGGSIRWNCCNTNGERVASGVYHVICNTADAGNTVVTRIIVLK